MTIDTVSLAPSGLEPEHHKCEHEGCSRRATEFVRDFYVAVNPATGFKESKVKGAPHWFCNWPRREPEETEVSWEEFRRV